MKEVIALCIIIFSISSYTSANEDCDQAIVESPLDLSLVSFIENVDAILPLRSFAVEIKNETTGDVLTSITNSFGIANFKKYGPTKLHQYTLKIYKTWDWLNRSHRKLLCEKSLDSKRLVDIHNSALNNQRTAGTTSSLSIVLDSDNLVSDEKSCQFIKLKRPTYQYKKL